MCLGWLGSGGQQVVVSTALLPRYPSEYDRRFAAAFLVFAGNQLRRRESLDDASQSQEALEVLANSQHLWFKRRIDVDGTSLDASITELGPDTSLGYASRGELLISFASVGVESCRMRVRTLVAAATAAYPADPTAPISDEILERMPVTGGRGGSEQG